MVKSSYQYKEGYIMYNAETNIESIHRAELEILKKCKCVCEKHNIPYFLCYGTLLGAVRHGGFIPWDDDIDIMIPSDFIEKFKECFLAEAGSEYFYSDINTEKTALTPWIKIRKNNTTSMPEDLIKIDAHWGICIDIFPFYPVSGNIISITFKKMLFNTADIFLRVTEEKYCKNTSIVLKILSVIPYKVRKATSNLAITLLKTGNKNSKYVLDGFMAMKREDISSKKTTLKFEDTDFCVPCEYDKYLKLAYGDYMKPPPEEERIGHNGENGKIIWDTERDYSYYKEHGKL